VLLPDDDQMIILLFIDEEIGSLKRRSSLNATSVTGQNVVRSEVTEVAA